MQKMILFYDIIIDIHLLIHYAKIGQWRNASDPSHPTNKFHFQSKRTDTLIDHIFMVPYFLGSDQF